MITGSIEFISLRPTGQTEQFARAKMSLKSPVVIDAALLSSILYGCESWLGASLKSIEPAYRTSGCSWVLGQTRQ